MSSASLLNRGRVSGTLLMLLGAWGALVPFIGPYFGYAYSPDRAWAFTSGRLWLSVVPGAAAFLGGLLVASSVRSRPAGAILAALGGVWFVIGVPVTALAVGSIKAGTPVVPAGSLFSAATMRFLEALGFFYGLGIVIVFFAALALGETIVARQADDIGSMNDDRAYQDEYGTTY